jgi:hypothetical protein
MDQSAYSGLEAPLEKSSPAKKHFFREKPGPGADVVAGTCSPQ